MADERLGELLVLRAQFRERELLEQVVLQRDRLPHGVEQELPPLVVVLRAGRVLHALQEVVAPLLVQLGDRLEFLVEIERPILLLDSAGGRLLGVDRHLVRVGDVLDGGIALHLLLDHGAQFQHRQLEHLERLPQLRRQNHHLALLLEQS